MKPPPLPAAEDQAALWAARLDGDELSAADREALAAWLAAHDAHRALLASYCQFSADLEQRLPSLAGIRERLAEIPAPPTATRPSSRLLRPLWVGAALAAAAVAVVLLVPGRPAAESLDFAAPIGGRHAATLGDGSRLELDAGTAASVELTRDERRVRLATGEAFFTVAPDAARPFFVETPAGSVRVTGTQFNVLSEPGRFEVLVREGRVEVRPGASGAVRTLHPGDRLVAADGRLSFAHLEDPAVADALAWREGVVVFDGTPLAEALHRFARHHGRTLTAVGGAGALRLGGRHRLDELDSFLATLERTLPVRVTRGLDGAVRVESLPDT